MAAAVMIDSTVVRATSTAGRHDQRRWKSGMGTIPAAQPPPPTTIPFGATDQVVQNEQGCEHLA
jgi:hypothetical protein